MSEQVVLMGSPWVRDPTMIVRSEKEDASYPTARAMELQRGRSRSHFRKLCKETPRLAAAVARAKENGRRAIAAVHEAKPGDVVGFEPGVYWL